MKDKLIALLTLLLALMRTPTSETASIEKQKKAIKLKRDEIDTMHGDEDFNSAEISELIDDITEVASTSEPDSEYAEVPDTEEAEESSEEEEPAEEEEEEPAPKKKSKKQPEPEEEEEEAAEEEPAEEEEEEEEPAPKKKSAAKKKSRR